MKKCNYCKIEKPSLKRPKTGKLSCVKCFIRLLTIKIIFRYSITIIILKILNILKKKSMKQ